MTRTTVGFHSPVGPMRLVGNGDALTAAEFTETLDEPSVSADALLSEAQRQLVAYFDGRLTVFDLPIAPRGTAFQIRVWEQLRLVPFGATVSYGQIAARLEMPPGASRAVGAANGANPIAIIVPCHRVIGAGGRLVGYAAGLDRKRFLLGHEAPNRQESLLG